MRKIDDATRPVTADDLGSGWRFCEPVEAPRVSAETAALQERQIRRLLLPSSGLAPARGWVSSYVGIPWLDRGRTRDGADCWGNARIVYEEEAGIVLPSYDERYPSAVERAEIAAIVAGAAASPDWRRVEEPRDIDMLVFRQGRHDCHVGVCCGRGMMLHVSIGTASRVERWHEGYWRPRLMGIYRHRELDL
jgi:cell wall-associated NlpC family hydrolase